MLNEKENKLNVKKENKLNVGKENKLRKKKC